MIRTQIQLTSEQMERLRGEAARRGVSIAAVIREAVDREIGVDAGRRDRDKLIESIGGFRSGHADIAENHDDHLDEAFSSG